MSRRLRIGLTGGIGSGKSTVAAAWAALGASVIDTDAIARELTLSGGAAIEAIRHAFGAEAIDATGALDRARMRQLAFGDASAKQQLEAILHPMIGQETERRFESSAADTVVFDVPLLVESGDRWRAKVDRVLVVDCPEATQLERVMRRSGWTRETVLAVIAQQADRARRRASADAVIYNDAIPIDAIAPQVRALATHWQAAAR